MANVKSDPGSQLSDFGWRGETGVSIESMEERQPIPLHAGIKAHLVAPVAWHAKCGHHQADNTTFS
jgi:hypothetical protein